VRTSSRAPSKTHASGGGGQAERLPTGHEDVLTAVVSERFPIESAVKSFEAQSSDVEET
jgi:hypothetical protein